MKINKHILTLLFSLLLFSAYSQNISFSKVIAPIENVMSASFTATGIVKQCNKYIISLIGFDTASIAFANNLQSLYFAEVDSNGENFKILNKYVQTDTNYYTNWGTLIKTHNGGFCFVGDIDSNYNNKGQHYIMLFDSSMNNILTKIIPHDTIWEIVKGVKETHDHGFVIVGGRLASYSQEDILIMKTDSLGNQIWKKTFASGGYSSGKQVEETPDHGFLICGFRGSYTTGQGDPFLIKTDSAGNLVWVKYLGNNSQCDGNAAFAITQEGDYIAALGYATFTYPDNTDWLGRINIIKYSPDGTQIWNRMYDTIRADNSVKKIQILPNNDFILMGSCVAGLDTNYYTTFMFKFNANGDSLRRKIYFYTDSYADGNYLYDNVLNSDGSITACGYVNGNTLMPYEKIWIMKTESNGNSPACDYTGIKEPNMLLSKVEINIYPNPTKDKLTIETNFNTEQRLEIINLIGQTVYTNIINKKKATINTSTFANGVYILKLSSDKETVVKKFVKE